MRLRRNRAKRIGIYAGVFNPIHAGHIAFALQAMKTAKLDTVVFVPERNPRYKPEAEHFAHRVAMIKRAIRPHPDMAVLELVDRRFTVLRTWSQLETIFVGSTLVMLAGSDMALHMPEWPRAERMLKNCELVVGVRESHELATATRAISSWECPPQKLYIFESFAADVTSSAVREALRGRRETKGLLRSVQQYARRNWLYISLENS
jgi:nicotinate-nucleotide adenylyltransferase